jgi:multidrug efflux pump subunit AcrA (membrane-fusion protein)
MGLPETTLAPHPPALSALQLARTPRAAKRTARAIGLFLVSLFPLLLLAPWTQTVHGYGRAIAFNPIQRPQFIVSPIEGRVQKWYVVEGDRVRAGQLLVDLVDNDPNILERLREQETLAMQRMVLADGRVRDQQNRLQFIRDEREVLLAEAGYRIEQAEAQRLVALQELERAKADLIREELAFNRAKRLFNSKVGQVASEDEVEEARRKFDLARAQVPLAEARVTLAEKTVAGAKAQRDATDKRTAAAIETEQAALKAAESEQAAVRQQYNQIRTLVERQANQRVYAPIDGTIFRILANAEAGGQLVRAGERLAVLVPDIRQARALSEQEKTVFAAMAGGAAAGGITALTPGNYPGIVAELTIDGNDLPLVRPGDRVIVQFEGWAAVQFVAYPRAAAGTFEGQVYLVDPTADEQGRFRILVEPAPGVEWPDERYLRQGVRAQGWVLIREVRLGYELWRLLNGFPPIREVEVKEERQLLGPVGSRRGK